MRGTVVGMAAILVVACASQNLAAQQVRGIVRDSAAAAPLPGAVVSIVDSAGNAIARTIADGAGRFTLSRGPHAATLHVIRIGYQPRDVAIPGTARDGADVTVEFAMRKLPAILDAVRVTDRELCPGSSDRGGAFQLWQQARAGLLAAVVAREANPSMVMTLIYERATYPNDDLIRRQTVRSNSGRSKRPFAASESPATFAARGYMREDRAGRTFFAPDADVLLDESFAATHCFHLQAADATHRDQIGLAFTPAQERDSIVDVSGVIWIDRTMPALRSFDFTFTQLEPAAQRAGVGGHLEFRNMSNGVSFIERWNLRLPILEMIPNVATVAPARRSVHRRDNVDVRIAQILDAGGQVMSATWPDHTSWREGPMGIVGTVRQRSTLGPIPFAIVTLAGTADSVVADARGEFTMTPVLPGRYTIVTSDTTLVGFAPPRVESRRIDVARGALTPYDATLEPLTGVVAQACRGQKIRPHTATLVGRVAFANGTTPRGASVRADWQADYNGGSNVDARGGPLTITNGNQVSDVDDGGRFLVCGVATERPIRLRLTVGTKFADTTVVVYDSLLKSVDWRPSLTDETPAKPIPKPRELEPFIERAGPERDRPLTPAVPGGNTRRRR
jgi:hypothetical protein